MRDPMELNFEGFEMHKWNIPTVIAQKVDELRNYDSWDIEGRNLQKLLS